ncbi:MAG: lysylphosphatidylglycerol synthase transmembrane domain-containing protein [Pseudomonadota bacterium]
MTHGSAVKYLLFVLKAAITLGLIWVVLSNIDMADTLERVRSVSLAVALGVLALLLGLALLSIMRWQIVMRQFGGTLPFRLTARLFFEGLFFNQALPSTVGGDGVRIYRAFRAGLPLSAAINSVVVDRMLGMTSLMMLAAVAQPLFYERVDSLGARLSFTAVFVVAVCAILFLLILGYLPERFRRWKVVRGLVALSYAARQAFTTPSIFLPVTVLSILGHMISIMVFYMLAVSLDLGVSFVDCLVMVPSVLLLVTVPISVAGWGLREGAMVAAFGLLGVPAGGAAAASVLYGIGMALVALPGGLLWFANSDRKTEAVESLSPDGPKQA